VPTDVAKRAEELATQEPEDTPARKTTRARSGGGEVVQLLDQFATAGSEAARSFLTTMRGESGGVKAGWWIFDTNRGNAGDIAGLVQKARQDAALAPILKQYQQTQETAQQQLASLQNAYRLGGAGTPQEKAQIQAQITYEDLIKQGVQSDLAHQIANQELANAMQELAQSVDANTTALQDQLDPIYTEGRAALRIGYYGEGSGGTMRTGTGTGYAGAANENAPPGGNLIVINNNFPAGAVMGDRRTQYLAANSYGRAVAATGK
jgi:hypothetical protein